MALTFNHFNFIIGLMFSVSSYVAGGAFKSSGHGNSGYTLHEPPCEMCTSFKRKVRINSLNDFRNTAPHVLDRFSNTRHPFFLLLYHSGFEFCFVIICIWPKSLIIFLKASYSQC